MCYAMCVGGGLGEKMTRHVTSARQKEEGQSVSRRELCSVRSAGGGFAAEEVWRCTGAGERKQWRAMLLEMRGQWSPRDEWNAGNVAEPSADKETSRDTSALTRGTNQLRSSEALSSVQRVRGGLKVLED